MKRKKVGIRSLIHDLRSPLARAKTICKLLRDSNTEASQGELIRELLSALEELDARMKALGEED